MALHLILFISTLSFLSGVVFAGLGLTALETLIPAAALFAVLFASSVRFRIALGAACLLFAGSFYYALDNYHYRAAVAQGTAGKAVQGIVVNDPVRKADSQSFYLKTDSGKLLVETGSEPVIAYGDALAVTGTVKMPAHDSYGNYLAKERVIGTMSNPHITLLSSGGGNRILALLIGLKHSIRDAYDRFLNPAQAALVSGLTLGTNENFPKEFLNNLSLSGMRHITAVSGFNISIIVIAVLGACIYFVPRRAAFAITFVLVACFIALIGFPASAVRAALMAFIAGLARETGRPYAPHYALATTAASFALANPKVPVYDIGFQLSFLAVIGIVYGAPVLKRLFRMRGAGFMNWKETLVATVSAQFLTAPLLIVQFQNFSLTALVGNVLVLNFIPLVTVLGFFLAFSALFLAPLAALIALVVGPLAAFIIFVVNTSAHIALRFNPPLGFIGISVYYGALFGVLCRFYSQGMNAHRHERAY